MTYQSLYVALEDLFVEAGWRDNKSGAQVRALAGLFNRDSQPTDRQLRASISADFARRNQLRATDVVALLISKKGTIVAARDASGTDRPTYNIHANNSNVSIGDGKTRQELKVTVTAGDTQALRVALEGIGISATDAQAITQAADELRSAGVSFVEATKPESLLSRLVSKAAGALAGAALSVPAHVAAGLVLEHLQAFF